MTDSADDAARAFVEAIVWGEHETVWQLLSQDARAEALRVGIKNGLDPVTAGRINDGLVSAGELDQFLTGLMTGLRRDFRSVDIEAVEVLGALPRPDGSFDVALGVPSVIPGTSHWDAGRLVVRRSGDRWHVVTLEPRIVEG